VTAVDRETVIGCRRGGATWMASKDAEGIAGTVARLQPLGARLIVLGGDGAPGDV